MTQRSDVLNAIYPLTEPQKHVQIIKSITVRNQIRDKILKAYKRAERQRLEGRKPTPRQIDIIINRTAHKPSWCPW